MTAKTHVATGAALTLLAMNPGDIKYLTLSLAGGVIGSIIPDIDSKNSDANQVFDGVLIIFFLTIIICGVIEYFFNIGIYKLIAKRTNINDFIFSIFLFMIFCIIGSRTNHRSFTHSIVGMLLFSAIIYISFPKILVNSFVIGYVSHILLDLLNHKGIKLFFPFKKRFCMDLCDSDGAVNSIVFYVSVVALLIILISYCI